MLLSGSSAFSYCIVKLGLSGREIEAKTRNALAGRTEAAPPALEAAGLPDLDAEEDLDLLEEEELAEARP